MDDERVVADAAAAAAAAAGRYEAVAAAAKKSAGDNGEYLPMKRALDSTVDSVSFPRQQTIHSPIFGSFVCFSMHKNVRNQM